MTLFIGDDERRQIAQALAAARDNPTPWAAMKDIVQEHSSTLTLEDMNVSAERRAEFLRQYPSQHLLLGSYTACLSFEEQPHGLVRHLSVSSAKPGKVPNEHVMAMLAPEFGFSSWPPTRPYTVWVEEFAPGHMAINLAELADA